MPPPTDPLESFHPIVRDWFTTTLGAPSAPQREGWPAIASGADTLVLAPTGTGKTLAAFLWELNALIVEGARGPLANAVHLLYVSPLKALNNDIQRNLERPLAELEQRFRAAGEHFPEIRVAVRTGDTPSSARARMLRRTPHVLITTPESLHILLTTVRGRTMFSALRAVVVDEIHAVAGSKRGAHLALTLERLARIAPDAPQRIGLSATQRPLDEIARYLGGCDSQPAGAAGPRFRPVRVVDCGLVKRMETELVSPVEDLAHVDGTIWTSVAPLVLARIRGARTTLVFVNNRGQAERMAARVNQLAGTELALPYHGSLSRERRFALEERLKAGELRAVITTSSLELGIDVGTVDLVLQLQSPKRVAAALQRVGRAGHTLDAVSRGVFVPTFRDDALEQMAIIGAMSDGDVEPTRVVQNSLDVLAQLIVAMVASDEPEWTASAMYDFVRRAYPYHSLTRAAFDETLAMLAGKYPSDVAAELDARVHWDRVSDTVSPARSSRMVAIISGGTIPDRGLYAVHLPDRTRLGELDEEFVHESRVGDAFQLGSSTWRISSIEHDRVVVVPAPGAPARMPFWHGEFMARSSHLSARVGELRRVLDAARTRDDLAAIQRDYHADAAATQSLVEYVQAQGGITGIVPTDRALVVEHFRDEVGGVRMVLHAPFGGRVNAPWGMALARRMHELLGVEVQVQTTDDGIMLRLPDLGAPPPTDVMRSLGADEAERLVLEEVGTSSLFGARFRMNAARALLLPRGSPRRRMPLWLQRLKAADLLQAVREFPSFPIVVETYRDILQDVFDMAGLRGVLERIASGEVGVSVVRTEIPSPFAASLQFGFVIDWMYGDDTPRAEARAALLSLDRALLDELMGGEGADDDTLAVVGELLARRRGTAAGRQARDADELAVLVDRAGDVTRDELRERVAPVAEWRRGDPVESLLASGRLVAVRLPTASSTGDRRFILVDSYARYAAAFGAPQLAMVEATPALVTWPALEVVPEALREPALTRDAARRELLSRYVSLAGPVSVDDVLARYDLPAPWVRRRLERAERAGVLVRGVFGGEAGVIRWCSRRLLEQARRHELARARKQIEAVPIDSFAHFLQRWQHLTPDTRTTGAEGTATVLEQLHGLARPAAAWERDYLPARVEGYDPAWLTRLTSSGRLVWAAEPRPATPVAGVASPGGPPAGVGRVRFFERGTGRAWVAPPPDDATLGAAALAVRDALRAQGASFTAELAAATSLGEQRLRDALRELVAAGIVTNDTVDALRDVLRWKPPFPSRRADDPDPTRWLPADFVPSVDRPVVQRRPNLRRLPKWKRPDRPGGGGWGGRWSLVHTPGTLGIATDDDDRMLAEQVARQWLARYGVVSRDWWRRERPAVGWRAIYQELKRLEFRGEVRRGYFVAGLAGAQFALPAAVEGLRATAALVAPDAPAATAGDDAAAVVLSTSDPANVHSLPAAAGIGADPLARPRGAGALIATIGGRIVLTAEGRGARIRVAAGADDAEVRVAVRALAARLVARSGTGRGSDTTIETVNGEPASSSAHAGALREAGFRSTGSAMRHYARIR
ncbi:MAG: DEAD/DEAH box helicase [Gemmatimonadaceae bacterium]